MAIYLRKFKVTREYEWAKDNLIKPNVSLCKDTEIVHYGPLKCEESDTYELNGSPYYPSTVDGNDSSFRMTIYYKNTHISTKCAESESYGSETVVVEIGVNPSTTDSRTVEGTYDYHGLEVPYSVTQTAKKPSVVLKYNVTDTSSYIVLAHTPFNFQSMKIDGVKQSSVGNIHTFDTVGEHTVEYTLTGLTIPDETFSWCPSLTSCTIENGITSIGNSAFTYSGGLTSIVIPDSVTSIGNSAFNYCSGLTSIVIPDSVTSIGNKAFYNCRALTDVVIPDSVTSIGNEAFVRCDNLTSCTINGGSIGSSAFTQCSGLTNCTLGNSVTSIGESAFEDCSGLTSIAIPDSITSISKNAFRYCSGLTSCTIGSGLTSIGDYAFADCRSLTSITVDANNASYDSRNNCNAIIETSTSIIIKGCNNTVIPNDVKGLGSYAFYHCSGLTNVTIPNGATIIDDDALAYCKGLTSIVVPDSVTSIGGWAFIGCSGLTSCTIGSGVTSIGNSAFRDCSGLTSVTIPDTVTSIGDWAFYSCTGLTSCTIGSGVTSIGGYAFSDCSSLTSIISNAATAPSISYNTFQDVKTGGTLTVPNGSSGYDVWMRTSNYYLGKYNWSKVEQ